MFSYRAPGAATGTGFALVADRFLAVAAGDADRAALLWAALDDPDAALEDIRTVLVPVLSDLAVVELVDPAARSVRIAVLGSGVVDTDAGTARSGPDGAWREHEATGVRTLTLRADDRDEEGPWLPLGRGVAPASRLVWGGRRAETPAIPAEDTLLVDRPRTVPGPAATLRLDGDRVLDLDLPVVLGRSPRPADHPGARLVRLPSPQREISAAHLEVRRDGDGLVATDLDSTNGTIVRERDGATRLLRHGASAHVRPGASLDLGDGVVAHVEAGG